MTASIGVRQALGRWGPPIVWMAVISFASTEAFAASETSRFIGPFLRWLLPGAGPGTIELLHGGIRKLGHVIEYGLLALLWYRALAWRATAWQRNSALRAFLICLGFAALDETHQAFEAARTGSLLDVGWDALGSGLGSLSLSLLGRTSVAAVSLRPIAADRSNAYRDR